MRNVPICNSLFASAWTVVTILVHLTAAVSLHLQYMLKPILH